MELYKLTIDDIERGIIINALNQMRTKQINEDKPTEPINELLLKYIYAETSLKKKRYEAR